MDPRDTDLKAEAEAYSVKTIIQAIFSLESSWDDFNNMKTKFMKTSQNEQMQMSKMFMFT